MNVIKATIFSLAMLNLTKFRGACVAVAKEDNPRGLRGRSSKGNGRENKAGKVPSSANGNLLAYEDIQTEESSGTVEGDGEDKDHGILSSFLRIINGYHSTQPYNHLVFLLHDMSPSGCGGTLVHKNFVLTAAHCMKVDVNRVYINAFMPWTSDNGGHPYEFKRVTNIIIHPGYDEKTLSNDFALLKLDSSVDDRFEPVKLPSSDVTYDADEPFTVMGFGRVSDSILYSKTLMETTVHYVPYESCSLPVLLNEDSMLCAIGDDTDACNGDSGGPLITQRDGHDELVGIVSWGIGCNSQGLPGVYSRVKFSLSWIYDTVCEDGDGGSSSNSNTNFCADRANDASSFQAYHDASDSSLHTPQVKESCASIDVKFTYVEIKNGKTKEKTKKCSWKDVSKHCDETVMVDGHGMALVQACPYECSADWCN